MMGRLLFALLALLAFPAQAGELRGHGGPVRAIAVDGSLALTGSFDSRAILWNVTDGTAKRVLRHHDDSVNAVAFLPGGRLATGGQDGRIAIWGEGGEPEQVWEGHSGPISTLSLAPDGGALASASWDGTTRVELLAGGAAVVLAGHAGQVNAVAWLGAGRLATGGYDGTLRYWSADGSAEGLVSLGVPINALASTEAGRLWAAGADGVLRLFDGDGALLGEVPLGTAPLVSLAVSPEGGSLAAGAMDGALHILGPDGVARASAAVGGPVWALAFRADGGSILAGGPDHVVRDWNAADAAPSGLPEVVAAADDGSRGAEVFRACRACHALRAGDGPRAGPSLHRLFGRRIATAPGYDYSPALREMEIVWTPETVAELFRVGPHAYTPGTKMPEQRIGSAEDRAALVAFLERATR